jgi:hypothetical protein
MLKTEVIRAPLRTESHSAPSAPLAGIFSQIAADHADRLGARMTSVFPSQALKHTSATSRTLIFTYWIRDILLWKTAPTKSHT